MKKRKNMRKKALNRVNWQMLIFLAVVLLVILTFMIYPFLFKKENSNFNKPVSGNVMLPAENNAYIDLGLMESKKLFDENKNNPEFIILDVSLNYNLGHIPGAVNYPFSNSFENVLNDLDKNKIYFVYSWYNLDSVNAAKLLSDNGFKKVYRLRDNYGAWIVAGYPIERN